MKRNLMVTGIVVGVMMLALGSSAAAQGRGGKARHGKTGRMQDLAARMMGKIDLTADQTAKVVKLQKEAAAKARPIGEKLRDLKGQSRAAWKSSKPDQLKIVALNREMQKLRGELKEQRISFRFDLLELLTPEQRAALSQRGEARPARGSKGERTRDRDGVAR